jgi:hypothetical protein
MKQNCKIIVMILVYVILTSGCNSANVDESARPNEAREGDASVDSAEGDYWDGGTFVGRPVYSLTFGVSQAAHHAFSECGLGDNAIETAVESYLPTGTERQMIVAQDSQEDTLWSVAMTVKPLTADIFEVTCSQVEP